MLPTFPTLLLSRRDNGILVVTLNRPDKITHIVVDGSQHELLVEQDVYRKQFWSAFDKFIG